MAANKSAIKRRLGERLAELQPAAITEAVWKELLQALAPVSERYLRELLHATGLPFDAPYAGVRQHAFDELEASLRALERVYRDAAAAGDRALSGYCRRLVIEARSRANAVAAGSRASQELRVRKREMAAWMLVWLEDPAVFPAWVDVRKRALAGEGPAT